MRNSLWLRWASITNSSYGVELVLCSPSMSLSSVWALVLTFSFDNCYSNLSLGNSWPQVRSSDVVSSFRLRTVSSFDSSGSLSRLINLFPD